ncbi:hypothetical protein N9A94_06480 [Akkermansiaceae bacterium]|nr:hypothetical protein [Akkermansiaceae bacterium]
MSFGNTLALNENALVVGAETDINETNRFVNLCLYEKETSPAEVWVERPLVRIEAPAWISSGGGISPELTRSGDGFLVAVFQRIYELRKRIDGVWVAVEIMEAPEGYVSGTYFGDFLLVHGDELYVAASAEGDRSKGRILCYRRQNDAWVFTQTLFTLSRSWRTRLATNGRWLAVSSSWSRSIHLFSRPDDSSLWNESPQFARMPVYDDRAWDLGFDDQRLLVAREGVPAIRVFEDSEEDGWQYVATLMDHDIEAYDYGGALTITEDGYFNGSGYRGIHTTEGHDDYAEGSCRFIPKDFLRRYDDWIGEFYTEAEIASGMAEPSRALSKGDLTNQECYLYGLDPSNPDLSKVPKIVVEEDGTLSWQYQLAQKAGDWSLHPHYKPPGYPWRYGGYRVKFRDYRQGVSTYRRPFPPSAERFQVQLQFRPEE